MAEFLHLMLWPFLACLVIAGIHVYLGLHVIARRVIFVDLALAQIAAFGAIYGALLGYEPHDDVWAIRGFSLLFACLGAGVFSLTRMRRERVPHEAVIGITYVVALAATILASMGLAHGSDEVRSLLAGSILWVRFDTILFLAILYAAIGWFHYQYHERFLKISLDPEGMEAEGINIRLWDFLFYLTFGIVVTNSVAIGGVLLVFSYLVIPSVIAVLFAETVSTRLVIGWTVGTLVSIAGVSLSYTRDLPSGPTIVVCFAGFLLIAALARYVAVSPSKARSLARIAVGALAVLLLYRVGEAFRKEGHPDAVGMLESPKKNERLMGLHIAEADSTLRGIVSPVLPRLLADPEPEVREAAVGLVERLDLSEMIGPVLERIEDPEDFVREAAIDCLGMIGDGRIVEPLLEHAGVEEDAYLKIAIADRILEQGDDRALGIYVDVMDGAEAPLARCDAYKRLAAATGTELTFDPDVPEARNDDAVRPFREMLRAR